MKKKTVNKVISTKFNEWVASIEDARVRDLVKMNSIITGGCIASMLLKEKINDYDVYFTNKETVKAVAQYYVNKIGDGYVLDGAEKNEENPSMKGGVALNMTEDRIKICFDSNGVWKEAGSKAGEDEDVESEIDSVVNGIDPDLESKPRYRPIFVSCNAITLSQQIQIVIRFYGDPDEIHQHYDYIHCTNYWLSKTGEVVLKQAALESLLSKELIYVGSLYPLASVIRTRKFLKRGWTINAGQYLKMCFQISLLDLSKMEVLEDQLIGVDVFYFSMLISALQEHSERQKEKGVEFLLDFGYLSTLIDKIF